MKKEQNIEMLIITYLHIFKDLNLNSIKKILKWYFDDDLNLESPKFDVARKILNDFRESSIVIEDNEMISLTKEGKEFVNDIIGEFRS